MFAYHVMRYTSITEAQSQDLSSDCRNHPLPGYYLRGDLHKLEVGVLNTTSYTAHANWSSSKLIRKIPSHVHLCNHMTQLSHEVWMHAITYSAMQANGSIWVVAFSM